MGRRRYTIRCESIEYKIIVSPVVRWKKYRTLSAQICAMKRNYGVVTLVNRPMTLIHNTIQVGATAPDFEVHRYFINPIKLSDFSQRVKVITAMPTIDTGLGKIQLQKVSQLAKKYPNVAFFSISCDLFHVIKNYSEKQTIPNLCLATDYLNVNFSTQYGLLIEELRLPARTFILLGPNNKVQYVEITKEVMLHLDYTKMEEALNSLLNELE